jgi:hypothetical protein
MAEANISHDDITVNEDTNVPNKAWVKIKKSFNLEQVRPLPLDTPIYDDKVKLVSLNIIRTE